MSTRSIARAALVLALACSGACGRESRRPNVVLVVVDTLRADAVLDPEKRLDTPRIDELARDGVVFDSAFSHAPITLPSHTALFSSRPPFETGIMNNGQQVREDLPLLAEWMADHGFVTRAVISLGTLHLGKQSSLNRGFDVYDVDFWRMAEAEDVVNRLKPQLDALAGEQPFFLFAHFCDPHEPYDAHETVKHAAEVELDGQPTATLSTSEMSMWKHELELAPGPHVMEVRSDYEFQIRWIGAVVDGRELEARWEVGKRLEPTKHARVVVDAGERSVDAEIRLWINDAPPQDVRIERYDLEVEFVDRWVGTLIDELKARGLYENTLLVFTSDHGESLGERNHVGHIQNVYDEQLHVPLIVKAPLGDPRIPRLAEHAGALVPLVDLTPTILEFVGLPPLPEQRGKSILQGGSRLLIAETHAPQAKKDLVCIRDERFKLIYDPAADRFEMYDLAADPDELVDVWAEHGGERRAWEDQLRSIAKIAAAGGLDLDNVDEATQRDLKALGY